MSVEVTCGICGARATTRCELPRLGITYYRCNRHCGYSPTSQEREIPVAALEAERQAA